MAIYHLRLKVISRTSRRAGGSGRKSVVAAASYRSGQRLYDDSQGLWFHYDKPDVAHTEILAPDDAPGWVFDRQALWNLVERAEKRVDSQLAREVEITLPRELTPEQRVMLVRQFVRDQFVARGMVADIAIHVPEAADGREQPHCHCLLSLRRLDASTPTGFAAKKEIDWNEPEEISRVVADARKQFNRSGSDVDKAALDEAEAQRNVNIWRRTWSEYANRALADAGSAARIDYRTLEAQGIFRPPLPYLGVARHIEAAYDYVRARVTQWISVKKRATLYAEAEQYKRRDPVKLAEFVLQLGDMAESFAAQFRKPSPIREVDLER